MTNQWERNMELSKIIGVDRVCEFSAIAGMIVREIHPAPANPNQWDQGRSIGAWHEQICDREFERILDIVHRYYSEHKAAG